MKSLLSVAQVADMLSVSKQTVRTWDKQGKLKAERHPINNYRVYRRENLENISLIPRAFIKEDEFKHTKPKKTPTCIELFAGAGGLALGFERAGINSVLLNEIDKYACATLRKNRPNWNVVEGDVTKVNFKKYRDKIDIVSGGFPCQTFSYAGKKMGLEDTRGTMFYEFSRCVKEVNPKIVLGENVRGLLNHDGGKTLSLMKKVLDDLGYKVIEPKIMKAIHYRVPQKRERLFIIAIRKDLNLKFEFPQPFDTLYTIKDTLQAGVLFDTDVPDSLGQKYSERKAEILAMVPQGGYWRDLPKHIQKEYMLKSYYLGGGKTGMARRMSWDEPSLTLTCAPAQKQTERCHPDDTRPFKVREYARIQTFPDNWEFSGGTSQQYKQIGNAVPVNLGYYMGQSLIKALEKQVCIEV
ncbi:MAG: DNA (cytosine-5-)-methyltransferase [Robiginitomaculum sp.]